MEARIGAFLATQIAGARDVRVTALRRIPGGASRETWSFDAAWEGDAGPRQQGYILRRDPDAGLLESDRGAEYAVYRALEGSSIPAPRAYWLELDGRWLDRPFFVMERIDHCFAAPAALMAPAMHRIHDEVGRQKMAILGAIHQLDWRRLDLSALGTAPEPAQCAATELEKWRSVVHKEELEPQPVLELALTWLGTHLPPPPRAVALVHGDYRTGNFLFDRHGTIRGVLDWEMAHFGDPLEDLAWASIKQWQYARDGKVGGLLTRREAIRLYRAASGIEVEPAAFHWWELLGNVKMAAIDLTGARSFVEGRTREVLMAIVGRMLPSLEVEIIHLLRSGPQAGEVRD